MKRACVISAMLLFVVGAGSQAWGQSAQKLPDLVLILRDGSIMNARPSSASVSITTPYGKLNLPLKDIQTIRFEKDRETASIAKTTGDRLTGVLDLKAFNVTTVFGKVSVGIVHIARVEVRGPSPPEPPKKRLVLHYTFDKKGPKVLDKSGLGNHGTVAGANYTPNGVSGGAYHFSARYGVSSISLGRKSVLRQTRAVTYSFWVRLETRHVDGLRLRQPRAIGGYVMGAGAIGGQGLGGIYLTNAALRYQWTPTEPKRDNMLSAKGRHRLRAGQWHHVAVSIDYANKQGRIYLDGRRLNTVLFESAKDWRPAASYNKGQLDTVGGRTINGKWHQFEGALDELKVHNYALSDAEVAELFASHKPAPPAKPLPRVYDKKGPHKKITIKLE